jgi:diketogulonate reductase-like aldo/keto reductase
MEKLVRNGKARAIGISNFTPAKIERILKECSIPPADHQIEGHLYLQQPKFAEYHRQKGIHITQYSPMGPRPNNDSGVPSPVRDPTVLELAQRYGKTPAQVMLAWGVRHGRSVIPKASSVERIRENLGSDFEISPEDLAKLDGLDKNMRMTDPAEEWNVDVSLFEGLPDE